MTASGDQVIGPSPAGNPLGDGVKSADELIRAAGWDKVPLLMQPGSANPGDNNPSVEALQSLIYDEDENGEDPLRSLISLKQRANELFRTKSHRQALGFYNQAIEWIQTHTSDGDPRTHVRVPLELESSIYSNRAACHLALGNYRSCLNDCDRVIDRLGCPNELVRKCLYRSAQACVGLDRLENALRFVDRLTLLDSSRALSPPDPAPETLRCDIQGRIEQRKKIEFDKKIVSERQHALNEALRQALESRGITITHRPFPPLASSLPPGLEPVRFERVLELEEELSDSTIANIGLIFPVYVLRPLEEDGPRRDLILGWHEDDRMLDRIAECCEGQTDSHRFYVITRQHRLLRCGAENTLKKMARSISKGSADSLQLGSEGNLELFLIPIGAQETEWIEKTKQAIATSKKP